MNLKALFALLLVLIADSPAAPPPPPAQPAPAQPAAAQPVPAPRPTGRYREEVPPPGTGARPARPQGFSFDPVSGISNKFLTPNGDGLNDFVVFSFQNPRDSDIRGEIFDLKGAHVADMTPGPGNAPNTLKWDGKSNGVVVRSGAYIYVLLGENQAFCGVVVVIL